MFQPLTASRRLLLTELTSALKTAGETLQSLAALEEASPVGEKGAWNYPLFLVTAATEALLDVALRLVPGEKGTGR